MPTVLGRMPGFPTSSEEWDGKRVTRTHQDQFEVHADFEIQLGLAMIDALAMPLGTSFPGDPDARLKSTSTKRSDVNRLIWYVDLTYTTQFSEEDAEDAVKPPDERRTKYRWSYETMQIPFINDAVDMDKPIVNSVEEPFEDMTDFVIPVLTVERFELNFQPQTILDYANHTNEKIFLGAPPKTVLCAGIEADDAGNEGTGNEVFQGLLYQRVRYVFKFKIPITEDNKGWVARYVDAGTRYKVGNEYLPYLTDSDPTVGKRERIVGPLDGMGGKLTPGSDLVILQFNKHPVADFDVLAY